MFLSCVIVARNEEKNIARCITSVLNNTKNIKDTEILLVDSCSSDRTLEIARRYPINIISLNHDWQLSPAAGRFSGVNNTKGEYILIIDGDMELLEGWLTPALKFMEENPKAAAAVGGHYDIYHQRDGGHLNPQTRRSCSAFDKLQVVDYIFGSSIFRRSSLLEAGNFNPYLRAEEEAEISYRLKKKGYGLFFLPYKAVNHYCIPPDTFQHTSRRVKNKLWAGLGDMFSWCLRNKYYSIIWKRFWEYFLFSTLMIINALGIVYYAISNKSILSLMFSLMPLIFIFLIGIKKRSLYQGILSVLNYTLISMNLISGLFRTIKDMSYYPRNVLWIKRI